MQSFLLKTFRCASSILSIGAPCTMLMLLALVNYAMFNNPNARGETRMDFNDEISILRFLWQALVPAYIPALIIHMIALCKRKSFNELCYIIFLFIVAMAHMLVTSLYIAKIHHASLFNLYYSNIF